jgi:hypothetical protein
MKSLKEKSKKEFWLEHIRRFHQSGQSRRQYCLEENLSYWTFRDWLIKISKSADTELVKLPRQVHRQINYRQSFIEIIVAQKISIRIDQGFNGELLRDLL